MQVMNLDGERPYHNNISRELVSGAAKSDGCLKLDTGTGWESEHDILAQKMVEHTNPSQHSYTKAKHQNGDKTGQVVVEDVSYDKDVVEIKLPDTVVSSDYGGHFVKDVCVDEGVLRHQKTSAAKMVDEKASPNFGCSIEDPNGDLREQVTDDSKKAAHELKPETVLPAACAADGNTEKQYSSGKENDLEGRNAAAEFADDLNDEKISLKDLLSLESAKDCNQTCMISLQSSENHKPSLDEAIGQVLENDSHEVISSETSELTHSSLPSKVVTSGSSPAMPEVHVVASPLDMRGLDQVNHYNPFIAYGSLEDKWESEYSLATIVDAAPIEPLCPVEKTDSFSDLLNGAAEGNGLETAEPNVEVPSSSSSDVHASEKSNGDSIRLADEATSGALDETAVAMSLSPGNVQSSDANGESHPKCETDGATDMRVINPRDGENVTERSKHNTESKSSAVVQKESVVKQPVPDGEKLTTQTGNGNPYESSFCGPNIMSDLPSSSSHVSYSGNISIRSDSSTTSTRSFAFPVLQTEWNSSPVRMAKPDRRRLRRHRGWRIGLLCCKF